MMFLFKSAFWLSVALAIIPSFAPGERVAQTQPGSQISATEAVSAASATVADMRNFCGRQPEACSIGSQALVAFGDKAQAGARIVYEFLNDKRGDRATGTTASVNAPDKPRTARNLGQDTLTPVDIAPAWRAPQPRREARAARPS